MKNPRLDYAGRGQRPAFYSNRMTPARIPGPRSSQALEAQNDPPNLGPECSLDTFRPQNRAKSGPKWGLFGPVLGPKSVKGTLWGLRSWSDLGSQEILEPGISRWFQPKSAFLASKNHWSKGMDFQKCRFSTFTGTYPWISSNLRWIWN